MNNLTRLFNLPLGFIALASCLFVSADLQAQATSPKPFLQWFDGSFETVENRMPDIHAAGYGALWLPPPGRADSGDQSVGYDVYDRFDLGNAGRLSLIHI